MAALMLLPAASPGANEGPAGVPAPTQDPDAIIEIEQDSPSKPTPVADIQITDDGRVELHVRDLDLSAALQLLSMQSQRNIIATEGIEGKKVTANLYDVTFEEALNALLIGNNCQWHEQDGFVFVYPSPESQKGGGRPLDIRVSHDGRVTLRATQQPLSVVLQALATKTNRNIISNPEASQELVTANLNNVPFEAALTAILRQHDTGFEEQDELIYVYSKEAWAKKNIDRKEATELDTRLFRLHYVTAEEAEKMITPLLSKVEGTVRAYDAAAETKGSIAPGYYPTITEMLTGSRDGVSESVERSYQYQAGQPPTGQGTTSTADEDLTQRIESDSVAFSTGSEEFDNSWLLVRDYKKNLDQIEEIIDQIDVRPQQVLVEATILRARLSEDNALGIDFNVLGGVNFETLNSVSQGVTDIVTGNIPLDKLTDTNITNRTDFNDGIDPGGYTFGLVKGSVSVFVRALEEITDTTILANPKMLVMDKQEGHVLVGREDGYRTTIVTQTAAIETVEELRTGTEFTFRPFIGDDGYIRMEVMPEDSSGGLTAANLPFKQTTQVTTNIMVRDGHTILIGGLFRESTSSTRSQVPVAGDIPILGMLARSKDDQIQREEVIILLTVHVIKDDEEADRASMAAIEDIERYRVGMRRGVMQHGRERLAQAHYRWAIEHLEHGNRGQALWDLDMALHNNPQLLAATKLKERVTGQREWDEEGSSVRSFLFEQIMKENGTVAPLFGRPDPLSEIPPLHGPSGFHEDAAAEPQAARDQRDADRAGPTSAAPSMEGQL